MRDNCSLLPNPAGFLAQGSQRLEDLALLFRLSGLVSHSFSSFTTGSVPFWKQFANCGGAL